MSSTTRNLDRKWNLQVTVQYLSPTGKNTSRLRLKSKYIWQTWAMRLPSVTYSYAVSHPTPVARFVTVAWLQVSINPWLAVILKDKGDSNQYSPAYPTFTFWYQKPYRNSVGGTQSASIESQHLSSILQLTPIDQSQRMHLYNTRPYHKSPTPTDVTTVHYVITHLLHPLRLFSVKH